MNHISVLLEEHRSSFHEAFRQHAIVSSEQNVEVLLYWLSIPALKTYLAMSIDCEDGPDLTSTVIGGQENDGIPICDWSKAVFPDGYDVYCDGKKIVVDFLSSVFNEINPAISVFLITGSGDEYCLYAAN